MHAVGRRNPGGRIRWRTWPTGLRSRGTAFSRRIPEHMLLQLRPDAPMRATNAHAATGRRSGRRRVHWLDPEMRSLRYAALARSADRPSPRECPYRVVRIEELPGIRFQ